MNGSAGQSTDTASIKPVSSLRSQFEGLNVRQAKQDDQSTSQEQSKTLKAPVRGEDIPKGSGTRASFDAPRSESPWDRVRDQLTPGPRTPGASNKRAESPTKSGHKRPLSMLIGSSPKLTPSVNIESPKSPPKGYFFNRSNSRSPERPDNTPFGKVRELISQHSSRSSTRPGTPQVANGDQVAGELDDNAITLSGPVSQKATKPSSIPPPVNRAEKPKIPAKPTTFSVQDIVGLVNQPRRPSADARISPFSTPPSSDEEKAPDQKVKSSSVPHKLPVATIRQVAPNMDNFIDETSYPTGERQGRPLDPRSMGFARPAPAADKRDPRSMGLSIDPPRPPSRENSSTPSRSNTYSERPPPRDPRDFGLSSSKPTPRHVSEQIRPSAPPVVEPTKLDPSSRAPVRDARLFGFSAGAPQNWKELGPAPATRRIGAEPPPRPSEEAKRSLSKARHPSPAAPDRSTKPPPLKHAATVSLVSEPLSKETSFPPPPIRNTFNGPGSPSIRATRSGSVPKIALQSTQQQKWADGEDSDEAEAPLGEPLIKRTEYPDSSRTNRRPPFFKEGLRDLSTVTDTRTFDVCGKYLCTTGYVTRVFDLVTGEAVMGLNHGQTANLKVSCVVFKPAANLDQEGSRIWIGNNDGEIQEIDIATHSVIATSSSHNKRAIIQLLRCRKDLWSLDDTGRLFVWPAHEGGSPSLKYSHISHQVQKGHTFSIVIKDKLWLATGKEIRVYKPGNEATFAALTKPLVQPGTLDVTSGAASSEKDERAFFGHIDGKVTIYNTKDYSCLGVVKASDYKINGLAFVGDKLWAAYKTGKIYVYDTSTTPWKVQKDWTAHHGPIAALTLDTSSIWTMQKLHVISLGQQDNTIRLWDGMLEDDWLETNMHDADVEYCSFREVRAAVVTWNVGASNPLTLKSDFIADAIHASDLDPPEILIFGFQEVVDLEDKGVATKGILGFASKKKDVPKPDQHQSGVYREWRDYLSKCVNRSTGPEYTYTELHTSHLIGLFQCIFIRQEEKANIHNLAATNVKCGMGGRYGNKGALITRFVMNDSSLCFVNCHLAAGQGQASHRNNDVATILEDESLPVERNLDVRSSLFVGGGDGSQILDHEICILNGDLNYRIDAIPRDTVVKMIQRGELAKLLERDQIMVSRRRVSGFRLSPFTELQIMFNPTYKYDLNTDQYDSSEKKRSPAWCDRILYRGAGRVKQTEYRRHDGSGVRISDHRPVSGMFRIRVKRADEHLRGEVEARMQKVCGERRKGWVERGSVSWLVDRLGVGEGEARRLIFGE